MAQTEPNTVLKCDIAIVGGGLAGGLAALALARGGFECAVIDLVDPASMSSTTFDGRTTAVSYANARLFRRLGLWEGCAAAAEPIRDILVTDGEAAGRFSQGRIAPFHLRFDAGELQPETPLGWIVENVALRRSIYDAVAREPKVALMAPARRKDFTLARGAARITLDDGRALCAKLVVAADGKTSGMRAEAGIRVNRWSYGQHGIVATIAHERPHKGIAQEFFLPSGPFAILPLPRNRSSLVWTEDAEATPAYLSLSAAQFLRAIEDRFGPYLGDLSLEGARFSYPLSFHLSQRFIAPRLALIGDAARAIHPIAGQGYNLGVKDIAALVDVLTDARRVGLDIGAVDVLERYERWRRFDSTMLALSTDALNRLFSNNLAPLRFARGVAMGIANSIAPLRRTFMRQAGADLGALPSLLQAE